MANEIIICDSNYAVETLNKINRSRHENAHCDFIIKVDGVEIPVHKLVVCANSDYFNAMLSHQETLESKPGIVEMKETDIESVKICIDFIYTGRAKFSYEIAERVLCNAKLFQLEELCEEIVDFLVKNLRAGTFFHSKNLATKYNCENLDKICDEFAVEHFEEIANENYFVYMEKRYIVRLLKSKKLKVFEKVKLGSLVKWIKHDVINRGESFNEMLKIIRLGEVPMSYRRYLVENEDLVRDSLECMRLFTESFFANVNLGDYEASPGVGLQGVGVFDPRSSSINVFDLDQKIWIDKQALSIPCGDGGSCTVLSLNDDTYFLSGNQFVNKLCYTGANATWQQMQSMNYKHDSSPLAVVLNGLIYAVGRRFDANSARQPPRVTFARPHGRLHRQQVAAQALRSEVFSNIGFTERYDPANNTWSELPQCNVLTQSSLAATSNAIYKIGGKNEHDQSSTEVQKYDPNNGVGWCNVAPLNFARAEAPAVGHNNKIYVLGGDFVQQTQLGFVQQQPRRRVPLQPPQPPTLQSIECYDEMYNTWTIIQGMQLPYLLTSACVVNGDIYACGRRNPDRFGRQAIKNTLLKLDFEKNSIEEVLDLEINSRIFAINMVE